MTFLTSCPCAPTSARSLRSTCSPVVAFVPGVHKSVWSSDQVPTNIIAASALVAVVTAASIPEVSDDQSLHPSANSMLIEDVLDEMNCLMPSSGVMPLFDALKKT